MRRLAVWGITLFLMGVLTLVLAIEVMDIALTTPAVRADITRKVDRYPVIVALQAKNSVHYGVHLLAGRTLSLCPCTRGLAAVQYSKAAWHARNQHQRALVTTDRPHTVWEAVGDTVGLGFSGIQWLGEHVLKVSVLAQSQLNRPE
jgi:hypothetical protein